MKRRSRPTIVIKICFCLIGCLFLFGIYYVEAALTVTSSPIDFTPIVAQRSRSFIDDVGSLNFTADPAYFTQIKSITITFAGSALSNGTAPFSVTLKSMTGTTAQTCTPDITSSCTVTFTPTYSVSAGKTKTVKVRIDSSGFYDAPGIHETLSVSINNTTDILWSDGVTDNIPLEATVVPLIITSALY